MTQTSESPAPCRTCQSPVRESRTGAREQSVADVGPTYTVERACTNPSCPTNSRDRSIDDVV